MPVARSAVAMLFGALLLPQTRALELAGIHWGDARPLVKERLEKAGFAAGNQTGNGDMPFQGDFDGVRGTGWVYLASNKAVGVTFFVHPAPKELLKSYQRLEAYLTQAYGAPASRTSAERAPFHSGDGHLADALRQGKASVSSSWAAAGPAGRSAIVLTMVSDLSIQVSFEGPQWHDELERRRNAIRDR